MHDRDPVKPEDGKQPAPGAERGDRPKRLGTKIVDDVFTDAVTMVKPRFEVDHEAYVNRLWEANPDIRRLLEGATDREAARDRLYSYLEKAE